MPLSQNLVLVHIAVLLKSTGLSVRKKQIKLSGDLREMVYKAVSCSYMLKISKRHFFSGWREHKIYLKLKTLLASCHLTRWNFVTPRWSLINSHALASKQNPSNIEVTSNTGSGFTSLHKMAGKYLKLIFISSVHKKQCKFWWTSQRLFLGNRCVKHDRLDKQ